MKIIFDLYNTGLGNNGGSRTLSLCAETLAGLGHDVSIFSNVKSRYTWHKINKKVKQIYGENMPKCDVAISTSPKSVKHTVRCKAKRRFYYVRGYEIFWCSEKQVHGGYRKLRCIVNSEWLQRKLLSLGVKSDIVYPGLDFDLFYNQNNERDNILGGLYHKKLKTKKYQYVDMIARNLGHSTLMLNRDISSPSPAKLTEFYNKIKVWMAPTELEGLHNPPMESSLCGCGLVATDHERSGMSDYAIPFETAMVYPSESLVTAGKMVRLLMEDNEMRELLNKNMVELLREKIGTREDNMKKMLEIIS